MFFDAWHWPQWTIFGLLVLSVISAAAAHGKPRTEPISFPMYLSRAIIFGFVLYAGHFWS